MNIFVGNVSSEATEKQLENLFTPFGEIRSVKIITDNYTRRSKGFAFVVSANYDGKRKIQKALFPQGLIVDIKNRQYLTSPMNRFVCKISSLSATYAVNKEGNLQHFVENSLSVARSGVEPETSGL
jgi:RNA recognition motif-containing protein